MKLKIVTVLFCLLGFSLVAQEINENANKYLSILKSKPTPGFMFDRFYGAWMESSDTKALEEYLKKLTIETASTEHFLLLAFYYQKEGQANKALNVFDSIENEKLLTADVLYYRAKLESSTLNFESAVKNIDKALALQLKDNLKQNLLKLKAQVQNRNGESAKAKKTFEALLSINETDKSIIEDVMEIQLAEGMYDEAKKNCQKLISLASDNYEKVSYQLKLGAIHKRLNEFDLAEKLFIELISLSGQDSWLLKEVVYQFEAIYKAKDNLTDLVKKYEEITKNNPQNVYLRKRYSSLLSEKGDKENSIKEFQSIVELLPGDRSIKEEYAGLLISNNKTEEAVKILESISGIQTGKKDYEVIFRMAELEFKNKKNKNAYQLIETFVGKDDLSEYEILRIGFMIQNNDERLKVIEFYEKFLLKKPEYLAIKESLIGLYLENNEKDKALSLVKSMNLKEDLELNLRVSSFFVKQKLIEDSLVILGMLSDAHKKTFKYNKKIYDSYTELQNNDKVKETAKVLLQVSDSYNEIRESLQIIRGLYNEQELESHIKILEEKKDIDFKEVLLLANLKIKAFKQEEALKLIEDNTNKFAGNIIYLELAENFFSVAKEFDRSLKIVELLIKNTPKETAKYLLLKTNILRRADKLEEAISAAKQLTVANNNKSDHTILLAELYQQNGESEKGVAVLRKASYENPDDKTIKTKLSDLYLSALNYNDSRRILWSLIEGTEDITEKISYIDKLITSYEYDLNLDALIENLKERKANNSKSTFPILALIRVYQRLNDYENKSKAMIELSQLKSEDVNLYLELATVMVKDLNYDGAENVIRKAMSIDKTDVARKRLIQFYFSIDKEDQALMELSKLMNGSFKEKDILEIAEKLISAEKYEKAYQFLKNNIPTDKSVKYQYVLAIAAKEAKKEEAQNLFLALLDIKEEFEQKPVAANNNNNQPYEENMMPEIFQELYRFNGIVWSYASYKPNVQNMQYGFRSGQSQIITMPSDLSELYNLALAHLGDMYREGDDNKKKEILNKVNSNNIKYAEIKLLIDQNSMRNGQNFYSELLKKNPENKEIKLLSAISDRSFNNQINTALLPVIKEAKEYDVKFAYWLLTNYCRYLTEIKQEFMDEADSIIAKINPTEINKLNLYFSIFSSNYGRQKTIPEEVIVKYKTPMIELLNKNFEKMSKSNNVNSLYYTAGVLYKFKEHELYAKVVNVVFASMKKNQPQNRRYRSYGRYSRYGGMGNFNMGLQYPGVVTNQLSGYFYELWNKNYGVNMDEEFVKKVQPLIENKLLKLAININFGNEADEEKAIKELEAEKDYESIQIVAAYYGNKQKEKETIATLNKALMLSLTVDIKKEINGQIAFYGSKTMDPLLKAEGVNAAKRLKNFNLSKDELLQLSMLFDALGETAEAEKLDSKISKMNTPVQTGGYGSNQSLQSVVGKFESLVTKDKNDAAFKYLISTLKPSVGNIASQLRSNNYARIDNYNFANIIKSIQNKNLVVELKKFISEQIGNNEEDLMTSAILLFCLEENIDAQNVVKKIIEKKPNDVFYKVLQYAMNLKNSKDVDEKLKNELIKNPFESFVCFNFFTSSQNVFKLNINDFKSAYFCFLDNIKPKPQEEQAYITGLIHPFLNQVSLSRNVYINSIMFTSNYRSRYTEDEKKEIEKYYQFFEETMLKCISNKIIPYYGASALMQYYLSNKKTLSDNVLQILSNELVEAHTAGRGNVNLLRTSYNGEEFMPLYYSLVIYLMNQDKKDLIFSLAEKLKDGEKEKILKLHEALKKLTTEGPITVDDINQIAAQSNSNYGYDNLSIMLLLANKVKIKNSNVNELIYKTIKEILGRKSNEYINNQQFFSFLTRQIENKSSAEITNFLLDLEKKILPEPFDKNVFEKNKKNYQHYYIKTTNLFQGENYEYNKQDFELVKNIFIAARKSEFYYCLVRSKNYSSQFREAPLKDIFDAGLFNGSLIDFPICKYESNNYFIKDILYSLEERSAKDLLVTMVQTDGIKLLTLLLEENSYKKTYEFLGTKIDILKSMPIDIQLEWGAFLTYQYKNYDKVALNDDGKKLTEYIASLNNTQQLDKKSKFLEEKFSDEMGGYDFLNLFVEVYPSLLTESDEKLASVVKSVQRKHKYYERNSYYSREDNYFQDSFVEKVMSIESTNPKHFKIVTDLLSQNPNWAPTYYEKYSNLFKKVVRKRLDEFFEQNKIAKNKNGNHEIPKELSDSFKSELLKALNEFILINNNSVPIYMIDFGEQLGSIMGKEKVLKELVETWESDKDLNPIIKGIFYEFKSFLTNDNKILSNYLVSVIEDPLVKPQIKKFYIEKIYQNSNLDKEIKQKVFPCHIAVFNASGPVSTSNPSNIASFINNYDYETLKTSKEETSKIIKLWYRSFEKAELEKSGGDDWRIRQFAFQNYKSPEFYFKWVSILKDCLSEENFKRIYNHPQLEFRSYLPGYIPFIKAGVTDDILETFNSKIELLTIPMEDFKNKNFNSEDWVLIETFLKKIIDPERQAFARLVFLRYIGYDNKDKNKWDLFEKNFKELMNSTLKDNLIRSKLLMLLLDTPLLQDKSIQLLFKKEVDEFKEVDLKIKPYSEIGAIFYIYCQKFPKLLAENNFDSYTLEIGKLNKILSENSDYRRNWRGLLLQCVVDNMLMDPKMFKNASIYFEGLTTILESNKENTDMVKKGYNYSFCLLYLSGRGQEIEKYIQRLKEKKQRYWNKDLPLEEALKLFKSNYLQNPDNGEAILKALNEFLLGKPMEYYRPIEQDKYNVILDFIKSEDEQKKVINALNALQVKNRKNNE